MLDNLEFARAMASIFGKMNNCSVTLYKTPNGYAYCRMGNAEAIRRKNPDIQLEFVEIIY